MAAFRTFKAPYRLSRHDGWSVSLEDIAALCAVLDASGIRLDDDPVDGYWCAFDADGTLVPHRTVRPDRWAYCDPVRFRLRDAQARRAIELGLPVPGTGGRSGGHYFRLPRHMSADREQAARDVDSATEESDGWPVPRVRLGSLPPNSHDDITRSEASRSWKDIRRSRWRERRGGRHDGGSRS